MKTTATELPPLKTLVLVKDEDGNFDIAWLVQFQPSGKYEWQCWNHDNQYAFSFFEKWDFLPE